MLVFEILPSLGHTFFPNGIKHARIKVFISTLGVKANKVDLIIRNNLLTLFCFPVTQQSV